MPWVESRASEDVQGASSQHLIYVRVAVPAEVQGPEGAILVPLHHLLVAQPQQALKHCLIVLADEGAGEMVEGGGLRQLEGSVLELVSSQQGMV